MVPNSKQSADSQATAPSLIKKFAYLDAESARHWDPQIAAMYYDQMVHHDKHHVQVICTCSAHLLDRVDVVLREDPAYQLRDLDGTPITAERARQIITEHYTVTEEVRQRNRKATRRERTEAHIGKLKDSISVFLHKFSHPLDGSRFSCIRTDVHHLRTQTFLEIFEP